jgi:hypothetical protein
MKKIIYILLSFLPVIVFSQQSRYKSSTLNDTWINVGNAGFTTGKVYYTSIAFNPLNGQPFLAYMEIPIGTETAGPASVVKFNGTDWELVGKAGFTPVTVGYTSLAFSPTGVPYVAYGSGCSSSNKATVMKYDGTNWVFVGNGGFSQASAAYTSIAFSPSGQPFVAYLDYSNNKKVTVMKFNGTNWVNVGSPGFSAGEAWKISLAFSQSGNPYVAYLDFANSIKATVMTFNGTNWVNVGSPGISSSKLFSFGFAVSPTDGQPYVGYSDSSKAFKATVKKFDGTNWVNVGNAGFSSGQVGSPCLAFNTSGQPYLFYWNNPGSIVSKFDGNNWVDVGNTNFTAGYITYNSFAISPSGQPYVAYSDYIYSEKATVMKYDFSTGFNEVLDSKLSLYPNPVTDVINIVSTCNYGKSVLELRDLAGRRVYFEEGSIGAGNFIIQLKTNDIKSGVYILSIRSDKSLNTFRIVVK